MLARLRIGGLLGAMALGLSACGFTYQELRDTQPAGSTDFQRELFQQYKVLADSEAAQFDWRSADHFAGKALAARTGDVAPDSVESRDLVPPPRDEIVAARARLVTALDGSGRAKAAKDAARAQVSFDCWMEQQEEAHQPADIDACKRNFLTAIAAVETVLRPAAAASAPARPAVPKQTVFLVYFEHNSAEIGFEPQLEINKASHEFGEQKANIIVVIGHADRSGNPQANLTLSRKRARTVADTLVLLGVPKNKIRVQSMGEGRALVATPDGAREPKNRVVEIRLQQ